MKPNNRTIRLWVLLLIAMTTLGIILTHRAEAEAVLQTLERGVPAWILTAIALQVVFYCLHAALLWSVFRIMGVKNRFLSLLGLWFRATFVSTIAPALGPVVFIQDAARRGESPVRTTAGTILVKVVDMGTLLLLVAAGFFYLGLHHELTGYELVASLVLLLLVSGWLGVLVLGAWKPDLLRRFLQGVHSGLTSLFRLARRSVPLSADWATHSAEEAIECARLIRAQPIRMSLPLGIALAAHLADLCSLNALCHAFHISATPGVLLAGFAVGILFWVVSLTPQGIGTVEGMMGWTFTSLGIALPQATAVSLAFRGLAYYLPLVIGIALTYFPDRYAQGVDAHANYTVS